MAVNFKRAYYPIEVTRHDSLNESWQIVDDETEEPIDLSEFTAGKSQARLTEDSSTVVIEFHSSGSTAGPIFLLDISQSSLGILRLAANIIDVEPLEYVYDVELTNSTDKKTATFGPFSVLPDVTR
jgi:hypothetical protein